MSKILNTNYFQQLLKIINLENVYKLYESCFTDETDY